MEYVPCALCGSQEQDEVLRAPDRDPNGDASRRFHVVRCRRCGLAFQNPRPTPAQLARFYPDHYYAYRPSAPLLRSRWWALSQAFEQRAKRGVRRAFSGYPCPGGRWARGTLRLALWPMWIYMRMLGRDLKIVPYRGRGRFLDVGCGTGSVPASHRAYGWHVTGVEWNASAAQWARAQYGIDVRTGTMEEARFPDRTFDVIHMSHVFEHLTDPAGALAEMARILDDGGVAVIKVPNLASASADRFGAFWLGLDLPRHLHHFTPATITALLRRHGFRVEQIRHDIGSWSFWRESARFEARERQGKELPDHRLRDYGYQLAERAACRQRRGSVLVVYAVKDAEGL